MAGNVQLSADEVARRRLEYQASWEASRRRASDPAFVAWLKTRLERLDNREDHSRPS